MVPRRSLLPFMLVLLTATGCRLLRPVDPNKPQEPKPAAEQKAPDQPKAQPATAGPAPSAAKQLTFKEQRSGLNDANIAAMVLALNNTDISYARLAPSRSVRDDVKQFAARMLTDHTGVNGLVNDLLTKLNVAPVDNTASLDMRDESANRRDTMREKDGFAFDSLYIENEVSYHQKFLATIDSVMLPTAKHAELKGLLTAVRPAVAAHLAHAEQVRANVIAKK